MINFKEQIRSIVAKTDWGQAAESNEREQDKMSTLAHVNEYYIIVAV